MGDANELRWVLTRCALVGAVLTALALTSAPALAATAKGRVLTPPEIAQQDQPAVQLIETDVAGAMTYYQLDVNTSAIVTFAQNDADIQSAGNAGNFGDVTRLMIGELTTHPDSYLGKGQGVNVNDELVYDGSGFNVTADGYIVTNTHVAVISRDEAIQGFVNDTLGPAIDALTKTLTGQLDTITFGAHSLAVPDDQQPAIKALVVKFIGATAQVGNITTTVYAGGGPTLSRNLVHKGQVARVVASGDVFPGKDVAILKIEARDLPVLTIGDDSTLQTGDGVHALGYPGDATFDPTQVADTVSADSTMSDGSVSNRLQSSKANYQIIENTATINHGSSGGPLVDDKGQVVGLTTAVDASTEQKNGVNGGKFFFAVPSSVITDLLSANHVVPFTSRDQVVFDKALDLMSQSHYSAALTDLRQAQADGYNTPYLQQRLDAANKAIAAGKDIPISKPSPVLLISGIGVGLVLLAILIVLWLGSRRRRKAAAIPPASGPQPVQYAPAMAGGVPAWQPAEVWPSPAPGWQSTTPPPGQAPPAPEAQAQAPQYWQGPPPTPTQPAWREQPAPTQPVWSPPPPVSPTPPPWPEQTPAAVADPYGRPSPPVPPAPPPVQASTMSAGWYPDPSGRHQLRYWDSTTWTANVSDNGVTSIARD